MDLFCKKFPAAAGVVLFVFVASAAPAAAQMAWTERAFVNASIGQQWMDQRIIAGASFPLYDETANWEAVLEADDSIVFDVSAGYRVWRNLAIGAGFSRTTDTHSVALAAAIPDTLVFDAPHHETRELTGYGREENAFHLSAVWMVPVTDKFDIALLAGPSFFSVKQGVVSELNVTPGGTSIASTTDATISGSAIGYHAGVDGTFRITRNIGVGGLLRYTAATVDAPEPIVGGSIKAGGLQALVGARLRF